MKNSKYSAIVSLFCTIIPYISAILSYFISLPFPQTFSLNVIMAALFIISWFFLLHVISSLPEETLQKVKLLKASTDDMQRYWYVKYNSNSYISCSFFKICDNCNGKTESIVTDYTLDLTEKKTLGVDAWNFDGDEKLRLIYLSGNGRHSFIRAVYKAGDYDLIRIDDNGVDTVKVTGELLRVSPKMLRDSGVCDDERIAKKILKKFKLTEQNIEQLLLYVYQTDNSSFAKEVVCNHSKNRTKLLSRQNSSVVSGFEQVVDMHNMSSKPKQSKKEGT